MHEYNYGEAKNYFNGQIEKELFVKSHMLRVDID